MPDPLSPPSRIREEYIIARRVTEEIHYFAYPRVGSHFLVHCLAGLFDLVAFPHAHLHNAEAIARQDEIEFQALYALDLREEGAVHSPLYLNAESGGVHGRPSRGDRRRIILIRHPVPTLFSFFRVNRDRWGAPSVADLASWLEEELQRYLAFYAVAMAVREEDPEGTLWVRYEDLVAGPECLREIVRFVGRKPKLAPDFVHWITRFERFARPVVAGDQRTFYREARPDAYAEDPAWRALVERLDVTRWQHLGYRPRPGPG